jgi:serine/threonine-protein kinase HipA
MTAALAVWVERERMGELSTERGAWRFQYAPPWLAGEEAFPLSPHFPLGEERFEDSSEERPVQWFFDNLLPEGGILQALARFAGLSERDSFGLLARFGEESAGALTLLSADQPQPSEGTYQPLAIGELRALIADLPQVPLIAAHGRVKMSLAGAQHKLGVRRVGDAFFLPVGAASSHIIKPENARPERYPFCPANEHFCMALARETGLPVPETSLLHIPEPIYIVARFDRRIEGERVERLHQIDLCQLLNKWPGYKYEGEGGATFAEAFAALEETRQPAVARDRLLRWLVFNYLIGNSDAHAKNIAFLVSHAGITLAPFYDLICVKAYGDDAMAMSVAGETRYGWITAAQWDCLAESLRIRKALLRRIRDELSRAVQRVARRVAERPEFSAAEREFLTQVLGVIDEHAGFMREGL